MKKSILIALGIILLLVLVWFFWPRSHPPVPQPATTGPSEAAPPAPAPSTAVPYVYHPPPPPPPVVVPPTSTAGLHLDSSQSAKLGPMLKDEDKKITAIVNNPKLTSEQKLAEMHKVREADQTATEHILSAEQYQRLVIVENEHDGNVVH